MKFKSIILLAMLLIIIMVGNVTATTTGNDWQPTISETYASANTDPVHPGVSL
ncbi:MAG: hypothetical protein GXY86_14950, partial [Firmicutes bacterium]|nr:hypothetical protein [Bacillota bacterium]